MPNDLEVIRSDAPGDFTNLAGYDFLDWAAVVPAHAELTFGVQDFFGRQSASGITRCEIWNPRGLEARRNGMAGADFRGSFPPGTRVIYNHVNAAEESRIIRFGFTDIVRGFGVTAEAALASASSPSYRIKLSVRDHLEEHWKDYSMTVTRGQTGFLGAIATKPVIGWANLTVLAVKEDGSEGGTNFAFGRLDLIT